MSHLHTNEMSPQIHTYFLSRGLIDYSQLYKETDKVEAGNYLGYEVNQAGFLMLSSMGDHQYRVFEPKGKLKYLSRKNGVGMGVPANSPSAPKNAKFITEGLTKAAILQESGYPCLSLFGVTSWSIPQTESESRVVKPEVLGFLGDTPEVYLAFDQDVYSNITVLTELKLLTAQLEGRGYKVYCLTWDSSLKGIDDYLATIPGTDRESTVEGLIHNSVSIESVVESVRSVKGIDYSIVVTNKEDQLTQVVKAAIDHFLSTCDTIYHDDSGRSWVMEAGDLRPLTEEYLVNLAEKFRGHTYQQREDKDSGRLYLVPAKVASTTGKISLVRDPRVTIEGDKITIVGTTTKPLREIEQIMFFSNGALLPDGEFIPGYRIKSRERDFPYYLGDAQPTGFLRFLEASYGAEQIPWIRAILRYLVDPTIILPYAIEVTGKSGSGKGTMLAALRALCPTPRISYLASPGQINTPERIGQYLLNKDLAICDDVTDKNIKDLSYFLSIVGGSEVTYRRLHSSVSHSVQLNCKFVMAATKPLRVSTGEQGWNRRIRRIATIPNPMRITTEGSTLEDRLRQEASLIMAWLLGLTKEEVKMTLAKEFNTRLQDEAEFANSSTNLFVVNHVVAGEATDYIDMFDFETVYLRYMKASCNSIPSNVSSHLASTLEHFLPQLYSAGVSRLNGEVCSPRLEGVRWASESYAQIASGEEVKYVRRWLPSNKELLRRHDPFTTESSSMDIDQAYPEAKDLPESHQDLPEAPVESPVKSKLPITPDFPEAPVESPVKSKLPITQDFPDAPVVAQKQVADPKLVKKECLLLERTAFGLVDSSDDEMMGRLIHFKHPEHYHLDGRLIDLDSEPWHVGSDGRLVLGLSGCGY